MINSIKKKLIRYIKNKEEVPILLLLYMFLKRENMKTYLSVMKCISENKREFYDCKFNNVYLNEILIKFRPEHRQLYFHLIICEFNNFLIKNYLSHAKVNDFITKKKLYECFKDYRR